ncbi:hypothetical protein PCANC_02855 [Puccinia coronata f. sp. avenae]|uniref:Uncharacterized protein n=1 Tax=Puccinia coronata f. sp. avenae TaxID=200324 RepID=A0A2N5S6T1_9BASI|nr:hypothetical protein PCASD_21926 [Puccinia coronata f. sp. avenae]PLW42269.1 hypothetical protein PCASD_07718 [Puccinia coronata f. sp. avenae]PLW56953.1 hypothetical protein PCANC_02855 [Puccinia coronata f. sp. avenae]
MRVSCFFVSVAIMLAQHASAAPVGEFPGLPSPQGELPIFAQLLDKLPGVSQIEAILPMDSSSGLDDTFESLASSIKSIGKDFHMPKQSKNDGHMPMVGSIIDKLPVLRQVEQMVPFHSIPGIDAVESLPAASIIESIEKAIPMPGLSKRNDETIILGATLLRAALGQIESGLAGLPSLPGNFGKSSSKSSTASHPSTPSTPMLGSISKLKHSKDLKHLKHSKHSKHYEGSKHLKHSKHFKHYESSKHTNGSEGSRGPFIERYPRNEHTYLRLAPIGQHSLSAPSSWL